MPNIFLQVPKDTGCFACFLPVGICALKVFKLPHNFNKPSGLLSIWNKYIAAFLIFTEDLHAALMGHTQQKETLWTIV